MRDLETGTTTLVSRNGALVGQRQLRQPGDLLPAGRYVAFESQADNLSDADNNAVTNIFLHDTLDGGTQLVSQASDGAPADGDSRNPSVSGEGEVVAFDSKATNLSAEDEDAATDVFTRNIAPGTTALVSRIDGIGGGRRTAIRSTRRSRRAGCGSPSRRMPTTSSPTTATSTRTCSWTSRGSGCSHT